MNAMASVYAGVIATTSKFVMCQTAYGGKVEKIKSSRHPALVAFSSLNGGDVNIAHLEASAHASFALTSDGRIIAWGTLYEEVDSVPRVLPIMNVRIIRLSCGAKHVLALDSDGDILSWGCGLFGRLGHGNEVSITTPRVIKSMSQTIAEQEEMLS